MLAWVKKRRTVARVTKREIAWLLPQKGKNEEIYGFVYPVVASFQ